MEYLAKPRQVLGLYRKREWTRSETGQVVYARFRYSDMKEAARDCGGRGLMQIQSWEGAVLRCTQTVP
jgi:hypothetical protein